jgi:hypothetical protein
MRTLAIACVAADFAGRAVAAAAGLHPAGLAAAASRRARLVIVNGRVLSEADLAAITHAR